jgi:hypothetical protein
MEWASSDAGDYPPSAHATAISGEPHDRADASESLVGLDADSGIAKARPGSGKPAHQAFYTERNARVFRIQMARDQGCP